ncbi:MAG: restriction endonuclease subunit S, partial [Paludibacteraceae bacterium]|nr:restriction endonuclease subunit S [Paludibacteraceae bacterium]
MKYEKYKDSGVVWLGEVPEHWEVCKIKHKYEFKTGATPSSGKKEFYEGDLKWVNIGDIDDEIIFDTNKHITQEAVDSCRMTISPKGSLLYSFKLSVGQVAFCGDDMYTNEAIATFNSQKQSLRYLYYIAPQFIIHNANRNIYNAPILNQDLIKNAIIVLPPLPEQQAIVNYLDAKCAKINGSIDVQKRKIELLNELKQTIITDAVTKGLNPHAPMKNSGVEWIGEVPEHWEVMKTSLVFDGIGSGTTPSTSNKNYYAEDDGLYWLQTGDLNDGNIEDTSKKITQLAVDECKLKFYPSD